jgi:hypothetical protein
MRTVRASRTPPGAIGIFLLALALTGAGPAGAQEQRIPAVVDYLAGANIYLAVGTDQGIVASDTLTVYATADGEPLGRFLVLSATATRAVVEFLGTPFPVTRGATLLLAPGSVRRGAATAVRPESRRAAGPSRGPAPSLHGRLSLEANAFESTTRWESNEPQSVRRRFATPTLGLRAVAADLPGGVSLHTDLRALYRYSDPELIDPAWAVQVYRASVAGTFTGTAVYAEAGRFINPFATLGGAWDGALVHVGGRGLGAGIAAGFEPDRGDQGVSSTRPKYAAFVTYDVGDGPVRYATDVSVHHVRPRDGQPTHTYGGWSQHLRIRRLRLGSMLQVDRHPATGAWEITRLNATAALPLVRGLEVRGRLAVFQPYQWWQATDPFPFRRDQAGGGLFLWGRRGSVSLDVTAARIQGGETSLTYGAAFSLLRTPVFGLDWSVAATYWDQNGFDALYGTAGIAREFGRATARVSYQLYRAGDAQFRSVSHTADLALSMPLARRVYATLQGRVQRGADLWTNGLFVGLWTAF